MLAERLEVEGPSAPLAKAITKFSWSDEGMKVEIRFELENNVAIDKDCIFLSPTLTSS